MFLSPELPTVGATKDTWVHFHFQICYLLRLIHVMKMKVYIKLIRNSVSTSFTIFFIKLIISVIRWNFIVYLYHAFSKGSAHCSGVWYRLLNKRFLIRKKQITVYY